MPEHFVRDGGERLRATVEAAVREEFAERLANVSLLERLRLQVAIRPKSIDASRPFRRKRFFDVDS